MTSAKTNDKATKMLIAAVPDWNSEVIVKTLKMGADYSKIKLINDRTLLHEAASHEDIEVAKELIQKGAIITKSSLGFTPIDLIDMHLRRARRIGKTYDRCNEILRILEKAPVQEKQRKAV